MLPRTLFRIELDQETFSGGYDDQDDRMFLVTGKLTLLPAFAVKFTRIKLELIGKLVIRQDLKRVQKVFYQHHWIFHGQTENPQVFMKDRLYSYPFRLPIPGDLPESVDAQYARIKYKFKATAEAPLYIPNLKAEKEFFISRSMGSALYLMFNTKSQGIWHDTLHYDISIRTLHYSTGSRVFIDFNLEKLAEPVQINFIGYSLKERTLYRIPVSSSPGPLGTTVREHSRWIQAGVSFFKENVVQGTVSLTIPKSPRKVKFDCATENVEVNHTLHIKLDFKHGHQVGNIPVVFPIVIKPASVNHMANTDPEIPPLYDPLDTPPPYLIQ
ncbi:hypothetical protein K493DRAFT_304695 [Basidiobolus meristosporus CBS 931.73]|uniref:Uncharacterized protein n=1 Tax=Basidiobolus meristosporus CBS 931.73 TaxID=1314790 RepID=A0A1Y1XY57_9FUNG|nr:hypothetical protein K493DRAFT_304695 [Basidiobolus meristosporus CBS 931.73]|eukprot:ORX90669.1 hypothetical protein K493DRAFT_304695 [Basidiobolus meristosporus CBS 931.73]